MRFLVKMNRMIQMKQIGNMNIDLRRKVKVIMVRILIMPILVTILNSSQIPQTFTVLGILAILDHHIWELIKMKMEMISKFLMIIINIRLENYQKAEVLLYHLMIFQDHWNIKIQHSIQPSMR